MKKIYFILTVIIILIISCNCGAPINEQISFNSSSGSSGSCSKKNFILAVTYTDGTNDTIDFTTKSFYTESSTDGMCIYTWNSASHPIVCGIRKYKLLN